MKKILFMLLALATTMLAGAQQKWDFTVSNEDDVAALKAATSEWSYTEASDRYESKTAIDGYLTAGGQELNIAKGLKFKAAEKKIRIDVAKRIQLAGKNVVITIPSLKKGQEVTIVFASTGTTAVTFDTRGNLTDATGFEAADKETTQTGNAKVQADGDVTLASSGGSINVFSIELSEAQEGGDVPDPTADDHSVAKNTKVNQAQLTLTSGTVKYYNTTDVSSIDIAENKVIVNVDQVQDVFEGVVSSIGFAKKTDQTNPVEILNGDLKLTEAQGWLESLYVKWNLLEGATDYNVYVKGGQYADFTQIDAQLVRNYGSFGRADVVGLKASDDYVVKVVPVVGEIEAADKGSLAQNIQVKAYDRSGYAHFNYNSGVGAYNNDGTLKQGAKVFYVTKNTAKTITTNVVTSTKGDVTECIGLQAIISAYEKGCDTTPIAFRFIGLVSKDDLDAIGSKEEGIQVKGRNADSELNLTFEGIGDDATVKGFGFLVRNSKSVEFRNFGIMRCLDDGLSLDTDNSNIWIHHMDVFYGPNGGGDHSKGDGAIDVKSDSKYVTVSYCHYWDTGKTNMFGMKSESGPNYISYHHNWFDHSDSRHPRVRTMTVHVWNNYFDNVAKYGVGATTGASVFVENNYFLKTKKPILASLQGTDGLGSGTFSGENGGMIKAYGNVFDRSAAHFSYYTQKNPSSKGYDAYETETRDEQVPETEKTLVGGTSYNNFDTNSSLIYAYIPDAAADVPDIVTGYYGAGRLNHGDFTYTFTDNVGSDDADSAYDSVLGGLLDNYKSSLVGFFSEDSGESGGGDNPDPTPDPTPEGSILASFDGAPSHNMFTVGGSYGDGKITYNDVYYKKGVKLDSKGSITFTPAQDYKMILVLSTLKSGRDVKVNDETTTVSGTENAAGSYYELQPITLTKDTQYVLTKGSAESIVMLIKLDPVE
jgi:pectate lyase